MNRWQWALIVAWLAWAFWMLVNDETHCRRDVSCFDVNNCNERLVCE